MPPRRLISNKITLLSTALLLFCDIAISQTNDAYIAAAENLYRQNQDYFNQIYKNKPSSDNPQRASAQSALSLSHGEKRWAIIYLL